MHWKFVSLFGFSKVEIQVYNTYDALLIAAHDCMKHLIIMNPPQWNYTLRNTAIKCKKIYEGNF
jgi:hypothetical protein